MLEFLYSAEFLSGAVGVVISVLFQYIPGLQSWFNEFQSVYKRLFMVGVMIIIAAILAVLTHFGFIETSIDLSNNSGIAYFVWNFILALGMNQNAYMVEKIVETK